MLKRLARSAVARAGLATLAGLYLRLALGGTRWTLHGGEHLAGPGPFIVAFWHECLPLMPALLRRVRREARAAGREVAPVAVLVSRHADGRLIGRVMRGFGVTIVHGSTARAGRERGGASAGRGLARHLELGGHAVITPDGPRGPRRVAAPGVARLAEMSGAPVVACAAQTSRRRVLRSWDRMRLPLPLARGALVCLPPVALDRDGDGNLARIAAALTQAAEAADALCGSGRR